jgi:hypothetical protein
MTTWVYEVQVVGDLSESALARIRAEVGSVYTTAEPATTVITGSVADQSALVGLMDLIHALGLEVCELRRVNDPNGQTDGGASVEPGGMCAT